MDILVLAHRGYRHDRFPKKYPDAAHENTPKAFRFAFKYSSGLETDVILSKQKTIYLTHDTLFDDRVHYELKVHVDEPSKKIIGDRFIFQMDDNEIKQLRMIDGQKFTKLDDLLEMASEYPDRVINLELKGPNTNDAAITAVDKAVEKGLIKPEQIIFSSFNLPALRDLREKVGSKYKIGALLSLKTQTKTAIFPDWPDAPQDAFYTPFKLEEDIMENEDLRAIQPDYFNLEYKTLSDEGVKAIDQFYPNAKIILWPAGEPLPEEDNYVVDIIEKFASTGKIYAVMSDFPELLQKALQEKGLAKPIID
jgi:glycerophosphoryl diester phosphodiesterase